MLSLAMQAPHVGNDAHIKTSLSAAAIDIRRSDA